MANCKYVQWHSRIFVVLLSTAVSFGQAGKGIGDGASHGSAPAGPPTETQSPASSQPGLPTVICDGTQLTITTNNSTLASVLAEVHKCIGVKIDMPDGAATTRLFDKIGPGPAREVLSSLLTATGFDFVIGSSDSNPDEVETVLLMARAVDASSGTRPDNSMSPARQAYMLMRQNGRSGSPPGESSSAATNSDMDSTAKDDAAAAASDNATTDPNQTPSSDQAPAAADGVPAFRQNQNSNPSTTSPSPAQSTDTREQITNMEKLFEQRRQMMLNQNSQSPK